LLLNIATYAVINHKISAGRYGSIKWHKRRLAELHQSTLFTNGHLFVAWSYTGNIAYNSSSGASSYDDMEKLDTALREEYSYEQKERSNQSVSKDEDDAIDYFSDVEEEAPESWTHLILGALFVLGDSLASASFKGQVLDTIVKRNMEIARQPDASTILCAYANTTKDSPLRQLLVHIVAYDAIFDKSHDIWEHYPVEFLTAVMVTLGRRLPSEQCKSCFKEAVDSNKIRSKYIDDVYVKKDQPPYRRDFCFYHEHEDPEEKNICLAAREAEIDLEQSPDD
ncbi:hypothetical protein KCU77_g12695, partial [Aureobasidium melanogenum]